MLEAANYPVREISQHPFGQGEAEIEATLYANAVVSAELDEVVARLRSEAGVLQAFWSGSAEE